MRRIDPSDMAELERERRTAARWPKAIAASMAMLAGLWISVTGCSTRARGQVAGDADPRRIIAASIAAMGGEAGLRSIGAIRLKGYEEESMLGVASRPDRAPVMLRQFDELRDPAGLRSLRHQEIALPMRPGSFGGPGVLTAEVSPKEQMESIEFAPERLLLDAADASDLEALPDTTIDGARVNVVQFGAEHVRLYIDATTGLPREWRAVRTYPDDRFVWKPWGDVTTRTIYSMWSLDSTGIRYPRRFTLMRNGLEYRRTSILSLEFNVPVADDSFPVRPGAAAALAASRDVKLGNGLPTPPSELAPGLVFVPGQFNVLLVRQKGGVIVIEAPHSIEYTTRVIDEATRRWPDPLTAVVSTTAAWPHLAGLRGYAARGVPIYVAPQASAVVRRMTTAPHTLDPDSLQRAPRDPALRVVSDSTALGQGPNRLIAMRVPVAGGDPDRAALIVWFPEQHVLYSGDILIPERFEPNTWRQAWSELVTFVNARGLDVRQVVGLHTGPTDWVDITRRLSGGASGTS